MTQDEFVEGAQQRGWESLGVINKVQSNKSLVPEHHLVMEVEGRRYRMRVNCQRFWYEVGSLVDSDRWHVLANPIMSNLPQEVVELYWSGWGQKKV